MECGSRAEEGYDLIFVDELHLFTEQERLCVSLLNPLSGPVSRLFMALDPRQAPYEVYAGYEGLRVSSGDSQEADRDLGGVTAMDLTCSASIHAVDLLISYDIYIGVTPTLDLGPDRAFDVESLESSRVDDSIPILTRYKTIDDEVRGVLNRARCLNEESDREERVAVVLLRSSALAPIF